MDKADIETDDDRGEIRNKLYFALKDRFDTDKKLDTYHHF